MRSRKREKWNFSQWKGGNKMINTGVFVGRVSTDIELKKTKSDISCCNFQLAVQRNRSDKTDFPPMSAYGRLAEIICEYVNKGDLLGVRTSYQSRIKNEKKYHVFVIEEIQFLQRKKETGEYDDVKIPEYSDNDFNSDFCSVDDDLPF